MERVIHPNDNAREARVTIWIFEGSSLFILIGAFAVALLGYRFCYDRLGFGTWGSLGVGAAPLVFSTVYVLTLKLGKPKSYDLDFFRSLGMRFARLFARSGVWLIRLELQGLGRRKTHHPYREQES
jgi:hypothetical protein